MTNEESWLQLIGGFGLNPSLVECDESKADEYYGVDAAIRVWTLTEGSAFVMGYAGFLQSWAFKQTNGEFVFTGSWE